MLQGQSVGDRVFGMAGQGAAAFGDAADLTELEGVGSELVEHIPAGREEVNFMGGNQGTEGVGVVLDEVDRRAVRGGFGAGREIDSLENRIPEAQVRGPSGKDPHDGGRAVVTPMKYMVGRWAGL